MFNRLAIFLWLLFVFQAFSACGLPGESTTVPPLATATSNEAAMRKVTPLLLNQIELRQQQMKQPTAQRLDQMQGMGMNVSTISLQRVFIHVSNLPGDAQVQDMRGLGVTVYLDSWIPPSGNSPTGFVLADMPVNSLQDLASRDYVIKLETAEKQSQPLNSSKGPK